MQLIKEWKQMYKSWSVWCMVLIFALLAIPDYLPVAAAYIPAEWTKWLAIVGIVARLIKQGLKDANDSK